ncbi:MAG: hypothetical protein WAV38_22730 [Xanthobacteraceae bacterium]
MTIHKPLPDYFVVVTRKGSNAFGNGKSSGGHQRASGFMDRDLELNLRRASPGKKPCEPGLTDEKAIESL